MSKRKTTRKCMPRQIRHRLGYPDEISDEEVWEDWNRRSRQVCKPCWELKYCPYGVLVEQSPLLPVTRKSAITHIEYLKRCVRTNTIGRRVILSDENRSKKERLLHAMETDPISFAHVVANNLRVQALLETALIEGSEDPIRTIVSVPYPPIEQSRTPWPIEDENRKRRRLEDNYTPEVELEIQKRVGELRESLRTNVEDNRRTLEPWRKERFEKEIEEFDERKYPEAIPHEVSCWACNVFGHLCPAVFVSAEITETSDQRRRGRYISIQTKMRVVRRDNYTCQHCGKHLLDNEIEFDHIIPVSRGGSNEEHNIRLTCFGCNRSKSSKVRI